MLKQTWMWVVEATETCGPEEDERYNRAFVWTFRDRKTAHEVYAHGERTVRHMRWSLTIVPHGNVGNAMHDIIVLLKED
jgi:hypothetical protein